MKVVGTETQLLEERGVEVVALASRGGKEGEVAVVEVWGQVRCRLRLRIEGQGGSVGARAGGRLLAKGGAGVEYGRVGEVGLRVDLLRELLRVEEVGGGAEGVETCICDSGEGLLLVLMLIQAEAKSN